MKRNRFLSCLLAAALTLTLTAGSAAAAYPDVPADNWAASYINDMTEKGVFTGYSDGTFKPEQKLLTVEAVALCARISVETALRQEIGKDRADQIYSLTGDENYWARDEFATCIEAGILSYPELKELWQSGDMQKPIAKEDFAMYLVRAMQLGPMAEHLSTYSLSFTDKASITPGLEPYVFVLSNYNIITGTDKGAFQPQSEVNRAVACTMLSKAMDFMKEQGTSVELANYTDYAWEAGIITSVTPKDASSILLTLQSDITGTKTLTVPSSSPVYENSMLAKTDRLKQGVYARVCYDSAGNVLAIRLSGGLDTVTGAVLGVTDDAILLNVNGTTRTLDYDRFTEVQVGQKTGDSTLIDPAGGYQSATCRVDQLDHLAAVQFIGGSREEKGLIAGVETQTDGGVSVVLSGLDGQRQRISVPAGTPVTVNNWNIAGLTSEYVGGYATLRVSNDDNSASAVTLDTTGTYIQGPVKAVGRTGNDKTVTITDNTAGTTTSYTFTEDASVTYEDKASTPAEVQREWFVTARVVNGKIAELYGYPGSMKTEGVITGISYPENTTLEVISVTTSQGTVYPFELDLAKAPQVVRDGKNSTVDKLRTGDEVAVTVRYGVVTLVEATTQNTNLSGTIKSKNETTDSITIEVELDNNGGTKTFTLTSGVTITQDKKNISVGDLRAGYHVAMVASGDEILAIDVDKAATTSDQVTGTVIVVNKDSSITLRRTSDNQVITVTLVSGTRVQTVSDGNISVLNLQTGDLLDLYGAYETSTTFKASIAIRK